MGLVYLVRHGMHSEVGHVLSGRSDIPLSPMGREQADALVPMLSDMPLASIHSSPRARASETAAPLARAKGLAVSTAPALDEIDFGVFTGRSFAQLDGDADWQRWNAERATARCPGGETMAEAVARAAKFVFALSEAQAPALCVTHCDVIRGLVAHVLGMAMERIFMLDCDPASVTTLSIEPGAVRLVTLNQHARR